MCMFTSPIENFDHGFPHSNALVTFVLQKVRKENVVCCSTAIGCQVHKTLASCTKPMKSGEFATVYRRIILSDIHDVIQSDVALHLLGQWKQLDTLYTRSKCTQYENLQNGTATFQALLISIGRYC